MHFPVVPAGTRNSRRRAQNICGAYSATGQMLHSKSAPRRTVGFPLAFPPSMASCISASARAQTFPRDAPALLHLHPRNGAGKLQSRRHPDSCFQHDCRSERRDARHCMQRLSSLQAASMSCSGTWQKDFNLPLPRLQSSSAASLNICAQSSACSTGRS